jgi:hypothetical protein
MLRSNIHHDGDRSWYPTKLQDKEQRTGERQRCPHDAAIHYHSRAVMPLPRNADDTERFSNIDALQSQAN